MSGGTSNRVMIVGNLGANPELKYMPNDGGAVLNLSVATSVAWKDKQSGEKRSLTEWNRCVLFGSQAENAAKYLKKGSKVDIFGQLRTRKWTDKQGVDHYTTEIMVRDIQYLDKAPENVNHSKSVNNAADAVSLIPDHDIPDFDQEDNIPF